MAAIAIASVPWPRTAESSVATSRMTIRTFLNCAARMPQADTSPAAASSFGPYVARRASASTAVSPSGPEASLPKTASAGIECHGVEGFGVRGAAAVVEVVDMGTPYCPHRRGCGQALSLKTIRDPSLDGRAEKKFNGPDCRPAGKPIAPSLRLLALEARAVTKGLIAAITLGLLAGAAPMHAGTSERTGAGARTGTPARTDAPPRVDAAEVTGATAIRLDGDFGEAVWTRAVPITEFVQRDPKEGAPPSMASEARVAYDKTYIYVAVRAFDTEPDRIVGHPDAARFRVALRLDPGGHRFVPRPAHRVRVRGESGRA